MTSKFKLSSISLNVNEKDIVLKLVSMIVRKYESVKYYFPHMYGDIRMGNIIFLRMYFYCMQADQSLSFYSSFSTVLDDHIGSLFLHPFIA